MDFGRHLQSWHWTKYHYFLFAAFAGAITVGYFPSWVKLLRDGWDVMVRNGFFIIVLAVAIVVLGTLFMVGFAIFTCHLLWGALSGIARSLHLFERGLIVARIGGLQAWSFDALGSVSVQRSSTPTTGSFDVSVTLVGLDGRRKLVVDKRKAIPAIARAARQPRVEDLP